MRVSRCGLLTLCALIFSTGCVRAPSPLHPHYTGSIGLPHRGMLRGGAMLPVRGEGFAWLPRAGREDRHWGLPRFVHAIENAAISVERARPGGTLMVGDISKQNGGLLLPHLSHRSGRDADLLLYLTDLDGKPVESPGFLPVGTDGLAWDTDHKRWLRWDIERQWLLAKALLSDDSARIQWIFVHHAINARLIEWARARAEPADLIVRAIETFLEPHPGGAHDDHFHIRAACAPEDQAVGCEPSGPARAWYDTTPSAALDAPAAATDGATEE